MFDLLMALSLSVWPFSHHHAQVEDSKYDIPAWHMKIRRDKFTEQFKCRLFQGYESKPSVFYKRHTLVFQFKRSWNTKDAWFQADAGKPQPWTSIYPDLVAVGMTPKGRNLRNPSEGQIMLPLSVLSGGHTIEIRPVSWVRPERFSIDGLNDALATAHNLGCDLDQSFE